MPMRDDRVAMRARQEALERELRVKEQEIEKLRARHEGADDEILALRAQVNRMRGEAALHKRVGLRHVAWFVIIGGVLVIAFWLVMHFVEETRETRAPLPPPPTRTDDGY